MAVQKGKTTGVKNSIPTLFSRTDGTYEIKWNKGGVIPKQFHGVFTSAREAEQAISRYNRMK